MPKEVACAIIRNDAGQILIGQRQEEGSLPGYWEFPGGGVEPGELPKQAVIREVQEELGVDGILKAEAEVITIDPRFKLHFFEVTITQPPKALYHQELRWVWPKELHDFKMPPGDEPDLERLAHEAPSDCLAPKGPNENRPQSEDRGRLGSTIHGLALRCMPGPPDHAISDQFGF